MSTNYGEKERAFLDALKEDTGRDLAGWMAAIAAQDLAHRNDIIDWLRQQGFMFSKASWIERIHHNGGEPIYAGKEAAKTPSRAVAPAVPPPARRERLEEPEPPLPEPPPIEAPPPVAAKDTGAGTDAVQELLQKAKAYRPLANYILSEIARAVPGVRFVAAASHVSIAADREFALLFIGSRELRLALELGDEPFDDTLRPFKSTPPAPRNLSAMTHMATLTDARQVSDRLIAAVVAAARRKA